MSLEDCIAIVESALGELAVDEKALVAVLYKQGDPPSVIVELVRLRRWLLLKAKIEELINRAMTMEEESLARQFRSEGLPFDAILSKLFPEFREEHGFTLPRSGM